MQKCLKLLRTLYSKKLKKVLTCFKNGEKPTCVDGILPNCPKSYSALFY